MKKLLLLMLLLQAGLSNFAFAQKTINTEEQLWLGVFTQTRLSQHWGIWADAHFRLKDNFVGEPSQGIIRVGPMFYINDDVRLTASYAYVHTYPAPGHANVSIPEHRPWQQVQWFIRSPRTRLMQWIRLEERFRRKVLNDDELADGYNFNWRIRYNFAFFIPITKKRFEKGGFHVLLNDEIFVNFGKNIVYNHFDQNRLFVGMVYQASKHAQVHLGYMNLYQQGAAGNIFRNQHSIRCFYFHNFDFFKH
ncbi:MAG: DUF2490 domain-containing protein [Chitinophagales bacterium]|nr:DUF2490 domain-containing protein [Chitinophagales bacterium]